MYAILTGLPCYVRTKYYPNTAQELDCPLQAGYIFYLFYFRTLSVFPGHFIFTEDLPVSVWLLQFSNVSIGLGLGDGGNEVKSKPHFHSKLFVYLK